MKCLAKYYYLPVFLLPWPCPGSPVHAFIFWMDLNNGDKMKLGPFKELVALGLPQPHGGHHLTRLLYSWSPATVGGPWCVVETESGRGKNTEFMGCSEEWSKNYQSVIITLHDDMDQFSSWEVRLLHEKTAWGRGGPRAALRHYYAA